MCEDEGSRTWVFLGAKTLKSHLLRDKGKVNSRIYYNGSLFKGLTPTLECEGTFLKKGAFERINQGIARVKLDGSILKGTDSYPKLIHSIH
jgi:hypothetical protein